MYKSPISMLEQDHNDRLITGLPETTNDRSIRALCEVYSATTNPEIREQTAQDFYDTLCERLRETAWVQHEESGTVFGAKLRDSATPIRQKIERYSNAAARKLVIDVAQREHPEILPQLARTLGINL